MNKITSIVVIIATLVAAAIISITLAQFANAQAPSPTVNVNSQVPPCAVGNCTNALYCNQNEYCLSEGCQVNGYCYGCGQSYGYQNGCGYAVGYGCQVNSQNQYGNGCGDGNQRGCR